MVTDERRKHPRLNSLNLLAYVCINENNEAVKQGMGRTLEISEGGVLLETYIPIDPQYIVSLSIGLKDDLADIRGKVIHYRADDDGKFRTGIQFVETDESTLQILKQFIKSFREHKKANEKG